jgi:acetylornithine deacetylase/succinyl-diaminopimelate desuccinylase-like protein
VLAELQTFDPGLHGLTRNTCSITRLEGSGKINVVPPEARGELDCRLLPDQDPEAFLAELGGVLGPEVEIEVSMGFTPAVSGTDNDLYRTLERVTKSAFPDAAFAPAVLGGFTDSHFFRDLGIVSYGFTPIAVPLEDMGGVHGNDERISEENVRRGVALTIEILERFVAGRDVTEPDHSQISKNSTGGGSSGPAGPEPR